MFRLILILVLLAGLVWLPYGNARLFDGSPLWLVIILALMALFVRPRRSSGE
ncbi:hypothetical protein IAI18_11960 [Acetobacteraceae bacterium H6797]|nr:hypothetical protein [Acetobacteraceae bacterium H6797]